MKKIFLLTIFVIFTNFVFASSFKISNTFGGNEDTLSGRDLVSDKDSKKYFSLSDRLQADVKTNYFNSRLRLDFYDLNFQNYCAYMLFRGYIQAGIPQISFVAGNSYFSKFDLKAGEIYALDLVPNYSKLLKSGLSLYSEIPFSKKLKLKLGVGVEVPFLQSYNIDLKDGENDDSINTDYKLDFGFDLVKKDAFSIGFAARDILYGANGKYSVLGGFNAGDFRFNGGFIYNNTDEDVLPDEARFSLMGTVLYKNDYGISVSTTLVSGLNSQYVAVSNKDSTVIKIKSYDNDAVPLMWACSFNYDFQNGFEMDVRTKLTNMIKQSEDAKFMLYPNVNYEFLNGMFEVCGGLKFYFSQSGTTFNLPISIKISHEF